MSLSEYVRRSRHFVIKGRHMLVCTKWACFRCVKPGGTAGVLSCPSSYLGQDFYICPKHEKGDKQHVRKENPL